MSIFKPDPIKAKIKAIRKETDRAVAISKIAGELAVCEDFFCNVIYKESLLAEKRRDARLPDHAQKERVHDAIVGVLATEESAFDLESLSSDQNLDSVTRRLAMILVKMQCMTPGEIAISPKEFYREMGLNTDDSVAPITFSYRSNLVDETFVNKMIDGVILGMSVKPLIKKLLDLPQDTTPAKESTPTYDFSKPAENPDTNNDVVNEFSNMR